MSGLCQRWRDGRHSWRHRWEGGFDSRRYDVDSLAEASARAFVERNHYSRSYPASRLRFGLYEGPFLVGVAVLSVPARREVLTLPFPGLEPYAESLELGRFVLADRVPANGESWFLARIWELAAAAGIRGVVSFSDPVPRPAVDGRVLFPGHLGVIYQASNATYLGRATPRTLLLLPDGTTLSERAVSKLRTLDRGWAYTYRRLRRMGAPPHVPGQPVAAWIGEALAAVGVRRLRHHGCHRYGFAIGHRAERRAVSFGLPRQAYPKALDIGRAA